MGKLFLTVAWKNDKAPEPAKKRDCTCVVCGKQGYHYPPWRAYEITVGIGFRGYEPIIFFCSEKCDTKDMLESIKRQMNIMFIQSYSLEIEPSDLALLKKIHNITKEDLKTDETNIH